MPALPRPLALVLGAIVGLGACAMPTRASAQHVTVQAGLDHGTLPADTKHTAYLRVALRGQEGLGEAATRPPMNVAIVIDKSGSMQGKKIEYAKAAARAALDRLDERDIVSVVAYDSTVEVLVPATRASDRATILRGIDRLRAGGMTALFAGTSKGAAEVRKFKDAKTIDRVILLSDGQANVGPQSPGALASLGESLRREGVGVTTIGMGLDYNEDLMVALARRSGGNHFFVEDPSQLARLFAEGFGGLASIVAQEAVVKVTFAEGVRPVRALGFDADIIGQTLTTTLAQIYGGEKEQLVVELEVSPRSAGTTHPIARIEVSYHDVLTRAVDRVETSVAATFTSDHAAIERSLDRDVMVAVVERLAVDKSRLAVQLRDEGKVREAQEVLRKNQAWLDQEAVRLDSTRLRRLGKKNADNAERVEDPGDWNKTRKAMRYDNFAPDYDGVNF
ncbi:MAG: VWA domain-containing protein [Deltaproteobacteria bacterium]|nr:MAG: VWA domain-containing protein [Deltaproteobacteria bacterium]